MAIDFQQIYTKIKEIGIGARARRERIEKLRAHARNLLEANADELAYLRGIVERAREKDPNIRCALPLNESLASHVPAPASVKEATLIAADGSQIIPDRHEATQFGLINVGAIVVQPNTGEAPRVYTDSQLLFEHELYTETGRLSQEAIEFKRDLAERKKLLDLANEHEGTLVALTDGPVEIWGAKNAGEGDYLKALEQHKSILSQLQSKNVTVAGYVDKPGADLVVRLLEITQLTDEQMKEIRKNYPLRGITDMWLYSEILKSGERSAVFAIQSRSRVRYTGVLSLHFFYLNVGIDKHPTIVRVEIPEWVAKDSRQLDLLHKSLIQQCSIMGAKKPYPYILHRAHEIAKVSFEEKNQISQMIQLEQLRNNEEVGENSGKQSAKNQPGRTRSR